RRAGAWPAHLLVFDASLGGASLTPCLFEVWSFETSLGGASLFCLRLLRCDHGRASGCATERLSALKKSRKGPASATSVVANRATIDSQTTIVRSRHFTIMRDIGRIR